MRGFLYESAYPETGGAVDVRREVWVPDAELVFSWVYPHGVIQVIPGERLPEGHVGRVELCALAVPYELIQAARRYLKNQEHLKAQVDLLKHTLDARIKESRRDEIRLQRAVRVLKR